MTISSTEITIIKNLKGIIKISQKTIKMDSDIKECILMPINYQDRLLGFIVAFSDIQIEIDEETIKLLRMFSTQIAPVIHSTKSQTKEKIQIDTYFSQIIKNKLDIINSLFPWITFIIGLILGLLGGIGIIYGVVKSRIKEKPIKEKKPSPEKKPEVKKIKPERVVPKKKRKIRLRKKPKKGYVKR